MVDFRSALLEETAVDNLTDAPRQPSTPIPFEHILIPFVQVAKKQLLNKQLPALRWLSPQTMVQLESGLLQQLSELCAPTLLLEFNIFRSIGGTPAQRDRLAKYPQGAQLYYDFVQQLLTQKLPKWLNEYPRLEALIIELSADWVEATAEMLSRLADDWQNIATMLAIDTDPPTIAQIEPNLSDPHSGHRYVHRFHLPDGVSFVYKPRSVQMARHFFALLDQLNQTKVGQPMATLPLLSHESYGWMKAAVPTACQSEAEVCRFYRRAGQLLALLYLLGGTDFHAGNWTAVADHPILFDLETLFHPAPQLGETDLPETAVDATFWHSVLRVGLLPMRHLVLNGADVSGLSLLPNSRSPNGRLRHWQWTAVNQDQMRRHKESAPLTQHNHLPTLHGKPVYADAYVEEILDGYRTVTGWVMANPSHFEAMLLPFCHERPRHIRQNTQRYYQLMAQLNEPKSLSQTAPPKLTGMSAVETAVLHRRDIPLFFAEPVTRANIHAVIAQCTSTDLVRQSALIRAAFGLLPQPKPPLTLPTANSAELQAALDIFAQMWPSAVVTDEGIFWLGIEPRTHMRHEQLQLLAYNLNSGALGIAVFLAALFAVTNEQQFRHYALESIRPLSAQLHQTDSPMFQHEMSVGGVVGLGSILYGLLLLSQLLGERQLLHSAMRVADMLSLSRLKNSRHLDVMSGVAGAVLALLAFFEMTEEVTALQNATQMAGRLAAFSEPTSGFAHGQAGVAYALSRLMGHTASLQVPPKTAEPTHAWCNGDVGVALAELGIWLYSGKGEEAQTAVQNAITVIAERPFTPTLDTLCCGSAGELELYLLAEAHGLLPDPTPLVQLKSQLLERVASLRVVGRSQNPTFPNIGFFHGLAGIGYQLLRANSPRHLPSILLFQTGVSF